MKDATRGSELYQGLLPPLRLPRRSVRPAERCKSDTG